ncbi:phosphoenolpyruvate carboxykinase (ATP) [Algoriphagus zhangzhouensis]|uniref:Phosphoenolpyruvate carboxykinase (ATP) n=1 Tax=Algoriphagus zhangzhouensis TaxID=1073327 RepID=A0A1M7Z6A5_9BACT|nr:phosphoenolpyruvate carboxykinase (ATP) [Algoriphagus zhangzhouensis]TDY49021.1 phosphoenolpyruvate carboxykinase (ATP) [Algoriphagus zhangzhouensis]SHO60310.1 phosphoenolpyruvate carboxykinase (ATP) [Algoriphagus zhangzhouensis]
MQDLALDIQTSPLSYLDLETSGKIHFNLPPAELVEHALARKEGSLTSTGALMADTGKFTGRSPKDRYIVKDEKTSDAVWWGDINIPFDGEKFDQLLGKMKAFLQDKDLFVRDAFAGADPEHRLNIRVINTLAWHNLFCHNMFLRPEHDELNNFIRDFTIICAPDFKADPVTDGTKNSNFAILNLSKRMILIGGTGYAGEMKKGIFSVLNFILPHEKNVLSMHCSANVGKDDDTAIFFGLSGTGKTTLSADPNRNLIGDDEHGWTETGVFNFEGGCYAKVIDLTREKEPEIWDAIRFGSVVENTRFKPGTREVDYENRSVTENTRTAYPIHYIPNAQLPSMAGIPKNIFFLTADAFGVIPPISKLNKSQAMYHFISGYTAKVAGTEMGITEPKLTFSACFGAAFLPLHPTEYATLFGEKMEKYDTNVWLINTGWTGGPYGIGSRMKLSYTRAMITAALEGKLNDVEFKTHQVFGVQVPQSCPSVPSEVLNPRTTWSDPSEYDKQAHELALAFVKNFNQFMSFASDDILKGAPNP